MYFGLGSGTGKLAYACGQGVVMTGNACMPTRAPKVVQGTVVPETMSTTGGTPIVVLGDYFNVAPVSPVVLIGQQ